MGQLSKREHGLTEHQVRRFQHLRVEIRNANKSFWQALKAIHDEALYLCEFATFDDFCQSELQISRRHAERILAHGKVLANIEDLTACEDGEGLRPNGSHSDRGLPHGLSTMSGTVSERATREIADLPVEKQREVFKEATKDGQKPTAKRVKEAREKVAPKADKPRKEKPREVSTAKLVDALISVRLSPARRELAAIADACGSREGPNYKAALDHFEGLLIALKPMREGKP